jgi:hypothetical protein
VGSGWTGKGLVHNRPQEEEMAEQDTTQKDPVDAELPAEKDKPVTEDRRDEPTAMQDDGE